MPGTQVRHIRKTVTTDGVNKYSITVICSVAGDLPDPNIFVMLINSSADPKNDTLVRVAQVADFSAYNSDRDDAVAAADAYWRSASLTLTYDDIETADSAWKELSTRISTLVTQFDSYLDSFETPDTGTVITYPTVDESTKNKLIDDYKSALSAVSSAETERDEHIDECEKLRTDLEVIEERLSEAKSDLISATAVSTSLSSSVTSLATIYSNIDTDKSDIRSLNNASSASATEKDEIESELRSMESSLSLFSIENAALSTLSSGSVATLVATLQSRVSSLTTDRNTKTIELNKCEATSAKLQGALDAAREARNAALTDVLAACPDFDSSSVTP